MSGFIIRCLAALCLFTTSGTAWGQLSQGGVLPSQRELARYGMVRAWWNQATTNPRRDRIVHLTADEDVVIAQSSSGIATCFDGETGRKLWAVQLGRRDHVNYRAVTNEELVLIIITDRLYALSKFDGTVVWELKLPNVASTSPDMDDDRVYIGCVDGSVYAFNLRKIRELYEESLLPEWSYQTIAWRFKAPEKIAAPPVTTGLRVSFASVQGSVYSVTADTRRLVFQFEADSAVSAPMAYAGDWLYFANQDFDLFCVNAENGKSRWKFPSGQPVHTAPIVIEDDVYLMPLRGGMHCLDTTTGTKKWWVPRVKDVVAASPRTLYATDEIGNVVLLSRVDGAMQGALPLRRYTVRFVNDRTDRLFLATESGLVVALHEAHRDYPIYHKFPERRPILPLFAPENPPPMEDATGE